MINFLMGLLDYKHSFYEFMKKMIWVFVLNILFILTSLPVITIGASATAMYSVLQKLVREREFRVVKDYFASFFRNFFKATILWLICAVVGVICVLDLLFFIKMLGTFGIVGYIMLAVAIVITIVFTMFALPVFPVLAEFEGSIKDTISVVVFMVKRKTGKALLAVLYSGIIIGFTAYIILYAEFIFIYFPLLAFALNGFVLTYVYDSILKPMYEEDEELEEYNGEEE